MAVLRRHAKRHREDGWQVGAAGLRRRDETGYWGHFWTWWPRVDFSPSQAVDISAGTVSPYLLAVFNRQRIDRPPAAPFIAVHSQLPIEPLRPDVDDLDAWLEQRLPSNLPRLVELSSDAGLLRWLTDESRRPKSSDLRYAALLCHHLGRDDEVERVLARAAAAQALEDERLVARGVDLSYRSDDQDTYPQDWSHDRFSAFLRSAPRELPSQPR